MINYPAIFGPGVTNDTTIPGYEITKFPVDLNTFCQLPNGTTRNFARKTQYVTYPAGRSNLEYMLAANLTSPNHIIKWNPMLIGLNLTQNTTNPYLNQQGLEAAYNFGYNMMEQMQTTNAIRSMAQALASLENGLTQLTESENLTNAQKAKIKNVLEEVKAKKEQISKKLANNPSAKDVINMQKEVKDLQQKVSDVATKIQGNTGTNSSDSSSNSTSTSTSDKTDENVEAAESLIDSDYENIDPKTGKPTALNSPTDSECEEFCALIERAIQGAGTDEETLVTALSGLNAEKVIEIIMHWEDTRGKDANNAGLFDKVFADTNDGEQKQIVPLILNALIARAEALGIYDKIKKDVAKVNSELKYERTFWGFNWFGGQDDNKIKEGLMGIYNTIVEKEKTNKTEANKIINNKKTENEQKIKDKKETVTKEKKAELAKKLQEELNLKELPNLSSKLEVVTDSQGEFEKYQIKVNTTNGEVTVSGQTYNELVIAIEKLGLKAEDCLIRKSVA